MQISKRLFHHIPKNMFRSVGYKKCGNYIVKLNIFGDNNENRKGIIDKQHAQYRTSGAFVDEIVDLNGSSTKLSKVESDFDKDFVYETGKIVEVKNYEEDKNKIYAAGIHYFLTFGGAKFCGTMPRWYTGNWICRHHDGQITFRSTWKKGKEDGFHEQWFNDGQLKHQGGWEDGKQEGVHKWWYTNGQLWLSQEWENGKEEGVHEVWHDDGQLEYIEQFKEGKTIT